ncbi:hypothetical protein [Actomonas aquatica]|uniref:RxLR effector protein n=1 Tax=Actomonas aquatica TaxID=2866162 RepID=A0ABZ1C628_9BACT|nr:hypothetical protein [Opitutus sp. WL0086]WRQ87100.1 hypothetical protein K1X11_019975 [Opitutus sp. WL0086]
MSLARFTLIALLTTTSAAITTAQDDTSDRKRGISSNLASALADTMPKFNPPPPKEEKEEDDGVDEDLMLKPKNGIVRLPQVVVEGQRPPVFTEREVHTDKGLADIAVKRYFSDTSQALNKFNIPFLTMTQEELAMMMWQEDERLRLLDEINDQSANASFMGDEEKAEELKELAHDTLGRQDYLPTPTAIRTSGRN